MVTYTESIPNTKFGRLSGIPKYGQMATELTPFDQCPVGHENSTFDNKSKEYEGPKSDAKSSQTC